MAAKASLPHTPVLLDEVLAALNLDDANRKEDLYLDATFGRGGHSAAILARLGTGGRLLALDRDPQAVAAGQARFGAETRLTIVHGAFGNIAAAMRSIDVRHPETDAAMGFAGVLFDLGVSSPQLDEAARGFSFMQDGPLDMRMDNSSGHTAAEWLAHASEREIVRVLREYGEERFAKRIANSIVSTRREHSITTTAQLAAIVSAAVPMREPGKHPATRSFQAIRMQVNAELAQLESALTQCLNLLAPLGRLCVISFHSLEDRVVKQFMQRHSQEDPVYAGLPDVPVHAQAKLKRVGRAIHPSAAEIARNPRSRSAILRIAERVVA